MSILRQVIQVAAFFFPSPINVWLHRLAGADIGSHAVIHPGVLILAHRIEIGREARIRFGTMINVRKFRLGRKSYIGYFTLVKGESDLIIGDACIIGPKTMINCSRQVVLDYYSGIGPGSYLYTHGTGMPVTEGYRATFAPIHIGKKVWINMRATICPGVTIGDGAIIMPNTVLVESIEPKRLVVGNPPKLTNVPVFLKPIGAGFLDELASKILNEYCQWSNEYKGTKWEVKDLTLSIPRQGGSLRIKVNDEADIVLLTRKGEARGGMFFNLADLRTDESRHPVKLRFEAFMRMHYGLIFL